VRASRLRSTYRARRALARVLHERAVDCVICHAPWSLAMFGAVPRRAGVPLVFWAHDAATGRHWTERLAGRFVPDAVIANSRFTASTVPHLFPGVPTTSIHAPVAVPPAPLDADDRRRLRASLATSDTAIVIIQASRSEPWKGHMCLVDALGTLKDLPGWVWWQVGGAQRPSEAAYLAELRTRADAAGIGPRVRWLGERSDVRRLMMAADIHVQANLHAEPFGMTFAEALASGLPVVTSSLGGALEIVDESCGILVPPDDIAALAGALRTLIVDEARRRRLASQASGRARHLCDPAAQIALLEKTLVELAPAASGE
jgi:glycosyltransferase involved in cell wall biosynthesis